ncbi:ABC transporter substrate-binding protein [Actinocatenispora sera]|uniref:ABC transporter substrate-binding protein n=2 Tax=Actinocatenispora sera TaxID=390989 RepID=A0A810KUP7_9ACTN|nr:ABC transporter substrate-binding protein [Actinocatenispora sera]BCJ26617.1 ABC transporter substrate-binding protein [Actinocatenispora sera]
MTIPARLSRRSLLVASGGAALALTGCGGGKAAGDNGFAQATGNKVPQRYAKRTRVVVWHAYAAKPGAALNELAKRFNESQSDVYVETQFQGSYDDVTQKVTAAVQARKIPDLVTLSAPAWHTFYLNDLLEPLDGYFGAGLQRTAYHPELLSEGVLKDKVWWVPFARSTPIFYYNKTLFAKAGLPDRGPATWDEWRGWAKQLKGLKVKGKQVKMEAYQKIDGHWQFQGSVWQWGGAYSDGLDIRIDQDPAVAAGEWQRKLIFDDKVAYMSDSPPVDLQNQLIATLVTSTGGLQGTTEAAQKAGWELGTAFVPKKDKQAVPTGGGGFGIMAYAGKERKQAAWAFIEYCAKPASAAYWALQTGYLPVVPAATKEPDLAKRLAADPSFSTATKQLAIARKADDVTLWVPNADVMIYTGLQKIWTDNQPAGTVFADVASQLRKGADKVRKAVEKHV